MKTIRCCTYTFFFFFLTLTCSVNAESHPVWDPGLQQASVGLYLYQGSPPTTIAELQALVQPYTSLSETELRNLISADLRGGAQEENDRYLLAAATYNLALLFHLTGDSDAAWRSTILLDRYADVFPDWPYVVATGPGGVWTDWYHNDFAISKNLALAFDLLAPANAFVSPAAEQKARELLVQIVQRDLEYRMYTFNWAFFRPLGLVIYGRVLDDPELVHMGYWFFAKHIHEYYTQDGYMQEGSYSYHHQMTVRMINPIQAYYFDGYSDPPGYQQTPIDHRWDTPRIDNYTHAARFSDALARMEWSAYQTLLPNGQFPVTNDTKHYGYSFGTPPERSTLLSGLGHAVLAGGTGATQTQARLDYSFTVGHRHYDALHLIYYGDQKETVGGTAYRFPDAAWNTSTFSQNLVAIDEQDQLGSYFIDWTMAPYVPGVGNTGPVQRGLWNQTNENLHNKTLLWEPGYQGFDRVQVVEADGVDAYRNNADRYRRMLALVHVADNDYYLADMFRVRGGTQYDWLLHGGHDVNTLNVALPQVGASGNLRLINFATQASTPDSWEASFVHGDTTGRVLMAGKPGTTVISGTAPRYEYGGLQDHLVVRRTTIPSEEEVFLAAHETHTGSPSLSSIRNLTFDQDPGTAVAMELSLTNGATDIIVYTLDDGPDYPTHSIAEHNLTVRGRFAHVRVSNDQVDSMLLLEGSHLQVGSEILSAPAGIDYSYRGAVISVERKESGAAENAFVVQPALQANGLLNGKTLKVTIGNGWTWSYIIDHVEGNRVITQDEPGFEIDAQGVDRKYFPIQEYLGLERFPGPVSYLVSGTAARDSDGTVFETVPSNVDVDNDGVNNSVDNCTLVANADQRDTDDDNIGNLCDPDFNQDCVVDFVDYSIFADSFLVAGDLDTDLNGDGETNFIDFSIATSFAFTTPGPSASPNGCDTN